MRTCSVDGCTRPVWSRELCNSHYNKMRRRGALVLIAPHPSEEQEQGMIEDYLDGLSQDAVGEKWGVTGSTVGKVLARYGIEARNNGGVPRRTAAQEQAIAERYLGGESALALGDELGLTAHAIRAIMRKQGIYRQVYMLDKEAFSRDTEGAAYWLGFIFADGSVEKGRLKVELNAGDKEHLAAFLAFLRSDAPVFTVDRYDQRTRKTYYSAYARVNSVDFVASLATLGVTPRKGDRAVAPAHFALQAAFWRGVCDGDGCLGIYRCDWGSGYYPVLEMCGSEAMMGQYLAWARTVEPSIGSAVQRQQEGLYRVTCTSRVAAAVIAALYGGATVSMERKLATAQEIIARFGRAPG